MKVKKQIFKMLCSKYDFIDRFLSQYTERWNWMSDSISAPYSEVPDLNLCSGTSYPELFYFVSFSPSRKISG
jgi:hypothetical protein